VFIIIDRFPFYRVNFILYIITLLGLTFSAVVASMSENPLIYNTPLQIARAACEVWSVCLVIVSLVSEMSQLRKYDVI